MKLKLDLHPIFSDSAKIESSLVGIIDEACSKRADEVEIIPGKGSGALKKLVMRFLDRPEIRSRYHRYDKDSDNFGRVFVYFKWNRDQKENAASDPMECVSVPCFSCAANIELEFETGFIPEKAFIEECGSCGSPNRIEVWSARSGLKAKASNGYE
jgi:hypothetical protein